MPQSTLTIAAQALDFGPALLFNLGFVAVTGWLLWMRLGSLLGDMQRRLTILTIIGLLGLAFIGSLSLGLAMAGRFSIGGFIGAWAFIMALLAWDLWRHGLWRQSLRQWHSAHPLPVWLPLLFFIWLLLYGRPFDLIIGGRDPGVYVTTAAQIAEQGSLVVAAPFLAGLEPAVQSQLLWNPIWLPDFIPYKWPGFFWIGSAGTVMPQFFHLYPALMAPSYAILGHKGALAVLPVVVLSFGLLLAEMTWLLYLPRHRRATEPIETHHADPALVFGSLLPPLFLLLNPGSYWFGRFANADVPYGLFVFAALFFWGRAAEAGHRRGLNWPLALLCFGAALLTKIDSLYLLPGAVITVQIFHPEGRDPNRWAGWIAWGVVCGLYLVAVGGFSYPYVLSTLRASGFEVSDARGAAMMIAAGHLAILSVAGLTPPLLAIDRLERLRKRWKLPGVWLSLVTGTACLLSLMILATLFSSQGGLAAALAALLAYVPWPMLLASLAGLALLVLRARDRVLALPLVAVFFSTGLFILLQIRGADHPWSERRATSVALPILMLCAGLAVTEVARWIQAQKGVSLLFRIARWLLPSAVVVIVLASMARPILSSFQHQEAAGARKRLLLLDSVFPEDAVIFSAAARAMDLFGPGLSTRGGREVLVFYGLADRPAASAELIESIGGAAFAVGRPFFVVTEDDAPPPGNFQWARVWWDDWTLRRMISVDGPRHLRADDVPVLFRVYRAIRLVPATGPSMPQVSLYEAEALPGQTGRVARDAAGGNQWVREARAGRDTAGALVYGPYVELLPGSYLARYHLRLNGNAVNASVTLKVLGAGTRQLAARQVGPEVPVYSDFEVPFELQQREKVEFSLFFEGVGQIWLDRVEVLLLTQLR